MANYTQSTFFGPKDALSPGDPLKKIKGSEVDAELAALSTAVASKADNTGPTSSFTSLADPGADRIAFWDDSATAFDWLNPIGSDSGLTISGTAMSVNITGLSAVGTLLAAHSFMVHNGTGLRQTTIGAIPHNSLTGFVANEHIDHSSVTLTASTGLSGGGTIAANRSFALDLNSLTAKVTPVGADTVAITDSAASNVPKKITFTNLLTYLNANLDVPITAGGTGATTAAGARTNLGLVIGTNVQAQSARLNFIDSMSVADGVFIVGDGSGLVTESGATARTSLGLGSIATRNVTVSTSAPSGGSDGDFWFVREA